MKFRLKALAAAALASVSGMALAAIDSGAVTGDGELFLMAYDTTSQQTYSFDTGLLMSAFAPGAASAQSFTLTGFGSFLSSATAATTRWGVYAADSVGTSALYTTALTGAAATNPNLLKLNNSISAVTSFVNATNFQGTHVTSANGWAVAAPTVPLNFSYGGNMVGTGGSFSSNLAFNTTGALTDTLSFLRITNGNAGSSARTTFAANWQLDSGAGTLVYAVPEPGTYALMLAGLFTLGAVARRRSRK